MPEPIEAREAAQGSARSARMRSSSSSAGSSLVALAQSDRVDDDAPRTSISAGPGA
jgi:hypothetical protein